MTTNKGFTFIELLITLAVMAICFLPLMQMYTASLEETHVTDELTTARYLAHEGMEKIKNSNYTKAQLKDEGDLWDPPLSQPSVVLIQNQWRVLRKVLPDTDPLEVRIQVFKVQEDKAPEVRVKPVVELVTLLEDLEWSL